MNLLRTTRKRGHRTLDRERCVEHIGANLSFLTGLLTTSENREQPRLQHQFHSVHCPHAGRHFQKECDCVVDGGSVAVKSGELDIGRGNGCVVPLYINLHNLRKVSKAEK